MQSFHILSESAMLQLGRNWARHLHSATLFLHGDLGAGKTVLARGIIAGFGADDTVASPTYNLLMHYPHARGNVYHLDLYRMNDPAELEMLGLRDLLGADATLLVEWPARGAGHLPAPDYEAYITPASDDINARRVEIQTDKTALPGLEE